MLGLFHYIKFAKKLYIVFGSWGTGIGLEDSF